MSLVCSEVPVAVPERLLAAVGATLHHHLLLRPVQVEVRAKLAAPVTRADQERVATPSLRRLHHHRWMTAKAGPALHPVRRGIERQR